MSVCVWGRCECVCGGGGCECIIHVQVWIVNTLMCLRGRLMSVWWTWTPLPSPCESTTTTTTTTTKQETIIVSFLFCRSSEARHLLTQKPLPSVSVCACVLHVYRGAFTAFPLPFLSACEVLCTSIVDFEYLPLCVCQKPLRVLRQDLKILAVEVAGNAACIYDN